MWIRYYYKNIKIFVFINILINYVDFIRDLLYLLMVLYIIVWCVLLIYMFSNFYVVGYF